MDCAEISFSGHALQRMFERALDKDVILDVINRGEVIAEYPNDSPYPSYLLLGFVSGEPVHVVLARNGKTEMLCGDGLPSGPGHVVRRFQDAEVMMKCVICKTGNVADGTATVILKRGETTIIIKDVPAEVCDQCGEYYLSEVMTEKVMAMAETAVSKGVEVEILRWAA